MIEVTNLTKTYHLYKNPKERLKEALSLSKKSYHTNFHALHDISFSIKESEIVGIIGNNGSGKSTLLKLITGVLTPTSGTISLNGKITALLELGAGFNPELTGMENIYLHGSLSGFSKKEMQSRVQEIIDFAEVGEFIYQAIKTYSSGMKARLAFSLAIHVDPEIFIIDEVLSVGDAAFQRKCFAKIESFKEQGKTILFVSHSAGQIVQLCHRAIWLHKGEKVIEGDSKIVTGLYQKYGATKELDFTKVQKEFQTKLSPTPEENEKKQKTTQALFNPKMVAKSTITYEENGAKISNVRLLTEDLQETNITYKNSEYFYSYDLEFTHSYKNINLAMLIKTKSGFEIGGKQVPIIQEKIIQNVQADKVYHVKWKFKNILNHGTYFFNCGVNTILNDEKVVLHRILDAYMFEVVPNQNDFANNVVDFNFQLQIEEKK